MNTTTSSSTRRTAAAINNRRQGSMYYLVAVFFLLMFGIAGSGYFYYTRQELEIKQGFRDELSAVADIKVDQITAWRKERISDARFFYANEPFASLVRQLTHHSSDVVLKQSLAYWLLPVKQSHDYKAITLLDVNDNVVFQLGDIKRELCVGARKLERIALETRAIQFSDIHLGDSTTGVHLDMVVPVLSTSSRETTSVGSLLFQIDPEKYLFPLFNQWPTPSRTAETLLLRREGEDVLYLNDLRHRANTALTFRLSVRDSLLPAARAARGEEGVVEGIDYRGVSVLAALRKIPHTQWFLIAKVDLQEINLPIRQEAWYVVALVAALLLAGFGGITSLWNRQRGEHFQAQGQIIESLQRSEEHYRTLVEQASDGIFIADASGRYLDVNTSGCTMLGYTREEILAMSIVDLLPPEDLSSATIRIDELREGKIIISERRLVKKGGALVPVEISARMLPDGRLQAIHRDITERKQAEETIKESTRRYREVVENATEIIFTVDKEGWFTFVNNAGLKSSGYTLEEFHSLHYLQLVLPRHRKHLKEFYQQQLFSKQRATYVEFPFSSKHGEVKWYGQNATLMIEGNDVTGFHVIARDITERKRVEEALNNERSKLRALIDNLPDRIYMKDVDARFVMNNLAHRRALGATSLEEVIGKTDFDFRPGELAKKYQADDNQVLAFGKSVHDREEETILPTGERGWLWTTKIPLYDQGGRISGLLGISRDITERKLADAALQNSEAQYRLMFSNNPQPMLVFDRETLAFLAVNDAIIAQYGYSREEFLQMTIKDIRPPEDIPAMLETVARQAGPYHNVGIFRHRKKDGTLIDVEITRHDIRFDSRDAVLVRVNDVTERRKAELALQSSEERLSFALLMGEIGSWELDLQNHAARRSLQHDRIFGYEALLPAWSYEIFLDHVLPEDRTEVDRLFRVAISTRGDWNFECRIRRCDGEIRWIWATGRHLLDENGEARRMSGIVQDISERKHAEKVIRDSEELYRTLISASPDAITVIDTNGIITFTSTNALKLFEHSSIGEVLGHNVLDWVGPEDVDKAKENLQYVIANGRPRDLEYVLQKADGTRFIGELNAGVLRGLDNTPQGIVIITRDITGRIRTEDELRASELRYRTLTEAAKDSIFIINENDTIEFVNTAGAQFLGGQAHEIIGRKRSEFFPSSVSNQQEDIIQRVLETGVPETYESPIATPNGDVWLEISLAPLRGKDEKVIAVMGVAHDITDRKRASDELRASEERYRFLVEHSPDGIAIHCDGKIVFVNAEAVKLLRATGPEQVIGMTMIDLIHPDYREIVKERSRAAMEGKASPSIEEKFLCLDGSVVDVEIADIPFTYQGRPAVQVVSRDITERKRAKEELLEGERRLTEAQRIGKIGSWEWVPAEDKLVWSAEMYSIFGIAPQSNITMEMVMHAFHPDDRSMVEEATRKTLEGKEAQPIECRIPKPDGTTSYVYGLGEAVLDANGKIVKVVGIYQDITDRRKAERALRESESRYRAVLTSATDAIITADGNGNIVGWNKGSERIFGYRYTEAVGLSVTCLVPQQWRAKHVFGFNRHRSGAEPHVMGKTVEMEGLRKDGSEFPLELSLSEWEVDEGQFYTGIIRDITERKRVEDVLQYHERLLRETGRIAQVGGWEFDPTTGQGSWTEEVARIHDLDIGAGTNVAMAMTYYEGEHRVQIEAAVREAIELAKPYDLELQLTTARGNKKWVRTIGHPVVENGKVVKVVGSFQDITKQRETSEHIQRLYVAIEQSGEIIFMTDTKGTITYVNPAFEETYGYTREESIGNTPRMLKSGLHTDVEYKQFWDLIKVGKGLRKQVTNKTKGGDLIVVDSSVNPVRASSGEVLGFIAVQKDITERQKDDEEKKILERQLFQAQKIESLGTLAGGIAHDFNNILAIILGHSSLLRRTGSDPDRLAKSVQAIESATQRGTSLVRQILTFARKSDVLFESMSINDSIVELVKLIEETFPKTVVVSLDLDRDLPSIDADRTQIHQTLLNLCVNARDAMPNGGTLSIRTSRADGSELHAKKPDVKPGSYLCICVADTGTGMDEDTKRRIFEPFFTTKEIGKGTGLGLALVHGIVESHKGYVDVESRPGAGTSFHLYFPVPERQHVTTSATDAKDEVLPRGNETLLLVEDEESLRQLVQVLFESNGYKVLTVADGESAVKLYRRNHQKIAAVITDFGLPKMDGGMVFHQMKRIHPDVKVILTSGYIDPALKVDLMKAGIKCFIQKPYSPNVILKQVRSVLDLA